MQLVHHHLHYVSDTAPRVLPVDWLTPAKRSWRGTAADGGAFGFGLEQPLGGGHSHGHQHEH